jgi:hypothetical protein
LPLPLLTTTVVSPGASVVSVTASAALIVNRKMDKRANHHFVSLGCSFEATKHTTTNPIAYISYHNYWGASRGLGCSKCQVRC